MWCRRGYSEHGCPRASHPTLHAQRLRDSACAALHDNEHLELALGTFIVFEYFIDFNGGEWKEENERAATAQRHQLSKLAQRQKPCTFCTGLVLGHRHLRLHAVVRWCPPLEKGGVFQNTSNVPETRVTRLGQREVCNQRSYLSEILLEWHLSVVTLIHPPAPVFPESHDAESGG